MIMPPAGTSVRHETAAFCVVICLDVGHDIPCGRLTLWTDRRDSWLCLIVSHSS